MLACTRDSKPVVESLIGHGALLGLRNKDGWTPFHIACRYISLIFFFQSTVPTLTMYLGRLVCRQVKLVKFWLVHLPREGHPDIITYILDVDPQCWDTKSKNGRTPLHTVGKVFFEFASSIISIIVCCYGCVGSSARKRRDSKDSFGEV